MGRPSTLRVNLIYGEEVHQSRILGEWSNLSMVEVYTTVKTFLVEDFKHG